jgi:carbonic anhydrase
MAWKTPILLSVAGLVCFAAALAQGAEKWTYDGSTGPAHWAELDPAFAACASGHEQSPVALEEAARHQQGAIVLEYHQSKLRLSREHETVVASVEPGSSILLDGKRYELLQFHFHRPSEHTLDGKHFPLEMHFVHKGPDGSIAVFGLFVEEGKKNVAIAPVLARLPASGAAESALWKSVDLAAIVGAAKIGEVFHYVGSFTTPPCTEGVSWNVREQPITWSKKQIEQLTAAIPTDNRPLQLLGDRTVLLEP